MPPSRGRTFRATSRRVRNDRRAPRPGPIDFVGPPGRHRGWRATASSVAYRRSLPEAVDLEAGLAKAVSWDGRGRGVRSFSFFAVAQAWTLPGSTLGKIDRTPCTSVQSVVPRTGAKKPRDGAADRRQRTVQAEHQEGANAVTSPRCRFRPTRRRSASRVSLSGYGAMQTLRAMVLAAHGLHSVRTKLAAPGPADRCLCHLRMAYHGRCRGS